MALSINELLSSVSGEFRPYHYLSPEADALTVYFADKPDYSKRLTDHITLYLALEDDSIVGCRVKGISGILEDLPNYLHVNHEDVELSVVFLPFRGQAPDQDLRARVNELAAFAQQHRMKLPRPQSGACTS